MLAAAKMLFLADTEYTGLAWTVGQPEEVKINALLPESDLHIS